MNDLITRMDTRRSSRIKAKGTTTASKTQMDNSQAATNEHTDAHHDSGQAERRPKKRRNTTSLSTTSAKKRKLLRLAKLKNLPEMPIDILYEIFRLLQPIDILNLARSTKPLRAILMSRSSRTVWKSALSNYGPRQVPACPFELNEPQYVDLAFSKHCHFCQVAAGSGVAFILWNLRVRCCEKCKKDSACLYILSVSEYYDLTKEQQTLIPWASLASSKNDWRDSNKMACLRSAFTALTSELSPLVGDEREHVVQSWKERTTRIIEDAARCEEWENLVASDAASAREAARLRRETAILAKLREEGWEDELEKMSMWDFQQLAVVKVPKDLTERAWVQMAPAMLQWMQTARTERLERARRHLVQPGVKIIRQIIDAYGWTLPADGVLMGLADVCLSEPFRSILANFPEDAVFERATFADANDSLPRLHEEWAADAKAYLLQHTELSPGSEAAAAHLDLATTQFACSHCPNSGGHTGAETLTHRHQDIHRAVAVSKEDTFLLPAFTLFRTQPWKLAGQGCPNWVYDPALEQSARDVVVACGRDADVTTFAEMTALDPWLQCKPCTDRARTRNHKVMSWRSAVQHAFHCHESSEYGGSEMWRVLNAADTKSARARRTPLSVHRCRRCLERLSFTARDSENHRQECLGAHLQWIHGVDRKNISSNFVATKDYPQHSVVLAHPT
ncbi:hypothetical protein PLICRDRAFT_459387 [Plicaturopsis crispa FD-325 SS-3]|nr:hypothetical protein PLICRDRAFT_459387 [Plicaturopsis crispa FD-325 SS-3]